MMRGRASVSIMPVSVQPAACSLKACGASSSQKTRIPLLLLLLPVQHRHFSTFAPLTFPRHSGYREQPKNMPGTQQQQHQQRQGRNCSSSSKAANAAAAASVNASTVLGTPRQHQQEHRRQHEQQQHEQQRRAADECFPERTALDLNVFKSPIVFRCLP